MLRRLSVLRPWAALAAAALAACAPRAVPQAQPAQPWVRVVAPQAVTAAGFGASGTVRARVESPLAFQVPGRIVARLADAGQRVRAGQVLMRLDARDLEQALQAAQADLAAAEAAAATAQAELARARGLAAQAFVSAQAVERAELAQREALARRDAAAARLAQARNARGYANLVAPAAGVLVEASGEPGQVVAAGQPVAVLAQGEAREIEVYLAETVPPPPSGRALAPDGRELALALREVAGAVEPLARTRRARYRVTGGGDALVLGAVVRVRFDGAPLPAAAFALPVGALDERALGARVWRVREGRVQPVPVQVDAIDETRALVRGALAADDRIVALGTHLLTEGMAVRELPR
jgi:RND family efflux transporter MFP subunit